MLCVYDLCICWVYALCVCCVYALCACITGNKVMELQRVWSEVLPVTTKYMESGSALSITPGIMPYRVYCMSTVNIPEVWGEF